MRSAAIAVVLWSSLTLSLSSAYAQMPGGEGISAVVLSSSAEQDEDEQIAEALDELGSLYEDAKEAVQKYEDARTLVHRLNRLDKARLMWEADPENTVLGIEFAKATAEGLEAIGAFIPESLPGPVKDYLKGLFRSVPNYVNALTSILERRIAKIEESDMAAGGVVKFGKASCSTGMIGKRGIALLRKLDIDPETKGELFRTACHSGMGAALRTHGYIAQGGKSIPDGSRH